MNFALLGVPLLSLASCKDPVDPVKDPPHEEVAEALARTWDLAATSGVTYNGDAAPTWSGFKLTFTYNGTTGGSYTTTGRPDTTAEGDKVLKASGTWKFKVTGETTSSTVILKDADEYDIALTVSDTAKADKSTAGTAKLSFEVPAAVAAGRKCKVTSGCGSLGV